MLIPAKHERLETNVLVVGADIIVMLHKRKWSVEQLFHQVSSVKTISLDQFFNILTYLYLINAVELDNHYLSLRENVS
jgi:hypothetical protein